MKKLIALIAAAAFVFSAAVPASAANAYDTKWGTFATINFSGTGADVVQLPKALKAGFIRVSHDGESNFIVHTLDSKLNANEHLVNEIGQYSGSAIFGFGWSTAKNYGFEIDADGNWTISVLPLSKAPVFTGSGKGTGVFRASFAARKVLRFTHDGDSNFIVHQYGTNGTTGYLVNEIGTYSGKKIVAAGTCIIEVMADGNWTIK